MLLVTGATGYLGAALIDRLRDERLPVRAMVRNSERAAALPNGVSWMAGDLSDPASLRRAVTGCTGVFHLAASLGDDLEETRRLNVAGTEALLSAAVEAGVRRFVHTSSSAAVLARDGLVSERAAGGTALTDPYSTSKSEAETLVLGASDRLDVMVVNPVNIYGPSRAGAHSYNSLFASAADGTVDAVVDAPVGWVLASDVAEALLLAYRDGKSGQRYVVCGEVAPFGSVVNRYVELAGGSRPVKVLEPGADLDAGAHPFAVRSQVYGKFGPVRIDDAQARALGCRPRTLAEGLPETAAWLATLAAGGR